MSHPSVPSRLMILFLTLAILVLTSCDNQQAQPSKVAMAPTPIIGEPILSLPSPIRSGDQVGISVPVTGEAGAEIKYEWTFPEGKGQIVDGQGTSGITYQAPTEPGTYKIGLVVRVGGTELSRSVFIKVAAPTDAVIATSDVSLPTQASTSAPTEETPISTAIPETCPLVTLRVPINGPKITGLDAEFLVPKHCQMDLPTATQLEVGGAYTGDLAGREFWVLVYAPNGLYYPQAPACVEPLLPSRTSGGRWSGMSYLGREGVPEQFDIVLTVASPDSRASQVFRTWLQDGCASGDFPGFGELPDGLTELKAITVHTE